MISPLDLKIGNYVKLGTIILDVTEIQKDYFYASDSESQSFKNTWAEIEPIPLTEEILLRLGFVHNGETKEENKLYTFYGKESKFTVQKIISFFLYDNHCFGTQIKYLHKLQNLTYELTGEELTLNF